jgi:hypothetical protein
MHGHLNVKLYEYFLVSFTLRRKSIHLENLDALTAGTLSNSSATYTFANLLSMA